MKGRKIKTVEVEVEKEQATTGRRLKKLNTQVAEAEPPVRANPPAPRKSSIGSKSNRSNNGTPISKNRRAFEEESYQEDPNIQIDSDEEMMMNLKKRVDSKPKLVVEAKKSPQKLKNVLEVEKQKAIPVKKGPAPKKEASSANKNVREVSNEAKPFKIPTHNSAESPLEGLTIVMTGVFQANSNRGDIKEILERLGAKVTNSVSNKTDLLIYALKLEDGRDYNEGNKFKEAKNRGTPTLSESEFTQLMKTKFGKNPLASNHASFGDGALEEENFDAPKISSSHQLWVDAFAPKSLDQIIGNVACVKKLREWIQTWSATPKAKSTKGSFFKAALISGPPGIGKTTAAKLCAKSCGKEVIVQNASDARNKSSVLSFLGVLTTNYVIDKMYNADQEGKECVIIMDEVDGMSGDRGGIQALIQQIKTSKTPIICICNDRQSMKIKSLANHCLDIKFSPPSVPDIQAKLEYILSRAETKGAPPSEADIESIAISANGDIRHAISNLQFWTAYCHTHDLEIEGDPSAEAIKLNKDRNLSLNVNTACALLFKTPLANNIQDLKSLFFVDYNMMPFYVFENYINITPRSIKGIHEQVVEDLEKLDHSLDSFMRGDYISQQIKENRDYQLLNAMSFYSAVQPAIVSRPNAGWVAFPQMLGKISSFNKRRRLLKELRNYFAAKYTFMSDQGVLDCSKLLLHVISKMMKANKFGDLYELYTQFDISPVVVKENICELIYTADKSNPLESVDAKSKTSFSKFYLSKEGDGGIIKGTTKGAVGEGKKTKKIKDESQKSSQQVSDASESEDEFGEHDENEFDFIDD
jgi:replication factor C subunit 1